MNCHLRDTRRMINSQRARTLEIYQYNAFGRIIGHTAFRMDGWMDGWGVGDPVRGLIYVNARSRKVTYPLIGNPQRK